ncbi:hypothetical protein HKX48_006287 [Thoreauomyces humboldtii]|nr:hypothetical protein HKX48_006287 [Thoreauomyces humboldtii]
MADVTPLPDSNATVLPVPTDPTAPLPASNLFQRVLAKGDTQPVVQPAVAYLRAKLLPTIDRTERKAHANPFLIAIWKQIGVPPMAVLSIASILAVATVRRLHRKHPLLLSNLIGVLVPAYQSIKAVERPEADDDERWLTYWSIFGLFTLLDSAKERIIYYVKYYYVPKMLILYWLFARNGSLAVYRQAIRPFLVKYGGYGIVHAADPASSVSGLVSENPGPFTIKR